MSTADRKRCFAGVAGSHQGMVRRRNEDSGGIHEDPDGSALLAVVSDGVGGHPGGHVASRLALDTVMHAAHTGLPTRDLSGWLESAVQSANREIRAEQTRNRVLARMATTIVALACRGSTVVIAHLGDSRAYRLRASRLTRLTTDHTVAQAMLDDGAYNAEDLARSPYRHVLTAGLGLKAAPRPSITRLRSTPDDLYLLCSDGLTNAVSEDRIRQILLAEPTLPTMADALVAAANAAGGPDNITVALVRRLNQTKENQTWRALP